MTSLSHSALTERLERLAERNWELTPWERRTPQTPQKRKFASVGDAVLEVLAAARADLRVMEVHTGVERLLDGPVSRSSVKNYLSRGCIRRHNPIERVAHGRYRLATRP
jgi:hypothetical protein